MNPVSEALFNLQGRLLDMMADAEETEEDLRWDYIQEAMSAIILDTTQHIVELEHADRTQELQEHINGNA